MVEMVTDEIMHEVGLCSYYEEEDTHNNKSQLPDRKASVGKVIG